MCGRYSLAIPFEKIKEKVAIQKSSLQTISPHYNISPSSLSVVISKGAELQRMRWGLVPRWAKPDKIPSQTFNARAESIFEKPTFRDSVLERRCLVPADSFYEWKSKQGFRIIRQDGDMMFFAGIWDEWKQPSGEKLHSFSIITVAANTHIIDLHHRMPLILSEKQYSLWLNPQASLVEIEDSLQTPTIKLRYYPVSPLVNRGDYDAPILHQPYSENKLF